MKDNFKCPHCGGIFGCTPDGKVGLFSWKIFKGHVEHCEKRPKQCKNC